MKNKPRSFFLFESDLIEDRFLLIFNRAGLKLARKAHPGVLVYHIQEFDAMWAAYKKREQLQAAFKKLHMLKKKFNGWLLLDAAGKLKFKWGEKDQ